MHSIKLAAFAGLGIPSDAVVAVIALLLLALPPTVQGQQVVIDGRIPAPVTAPSGHRAQTIHAVVATRGSVIAVEGETNSLVVLGRDGKIRSRQLNIGPGAAMLASPVDMAMSEGGEVLVLDAQTPRLARFSLTRDSLALSAVVRLRGLTGVSAVCTLRESSFVLASAFPIDASKLVHTVAQNGAIQERFGDAFGPPGEASRLLYGVGSLLCLAGPDLVVVASQYYPEVRAYDPAGALRWSRRLEDYRGMSYNEPAPGRIQYAYPADSLWDQTVSMFDLGDGMVAVQIGRRQGRDPQASFKSIRTLVLSSADGRLLNTQTDLPLVRYAGFGRLFSVDEEGSLWILPYSIRRR